MELLLTENEASEPNNQLVPVETRTPLVDTETGSKKTCEHVHCIFWGIEKKESFLWEIHMGIVLPLGDVMAKNTKEASS